MAASGEPALPASLDAAREEMQTQHRAVWLVVSNRDGTDWAPRALRKYAQQLRSRAAVRAARRAAAQAKRAAGGGGGSARGNGSGTARDTAAVVPHAAPAHVASGHARDSQSTSSAAAAAVPVPPAAAAGQAPTMAPSVPQQSTGVVAGAASAGAGSGADAVDGLLADALTTVAGCRAKARSKAAAAARAPATRAKATRRWKLLRAALRRGGEGGGDGDGGSDAASVSVRRHAGFGLLPKSAATPHSVCAVDVTPPHVGEDGESVVWPQDSVAAVVAAVRDCGGSIATQLCVRARTALATATAGTTAPACTSWAAAAAALQAAVSELAGVDVCPCTHPHVWAWMLPRAASGNGGASTAVAGAGTGAGSGSGAASTSTGHSSEGNGGGDMIYERYAVPAASDGDASTEGTRSIHVRRRRPERVSLADLASHQHNDGVDNTGNVCVWPAEEVLAHLCLRERRMLAGRRIFELGAGMTGLAGLVAAAGTEAAQVVISDGNKAAVRNLGACIGLNQPTGVLGATEVRPKHLVWNRNDAGIATLGPADLVVAADCLFFADFHVDLVYTLASLVGVTWTPPPAAGGSSAPRGAAEAVAAAAHAGAGAGAGREDAVTAVSTAVTVHVSPRAELEGLGFPQVWLVAPRRGTTMARFVSVARACFDVVVVEHYDDRVSEAHARFMRELAPSGAYDPDIHYPLLLVLTPKRGPASAAAAPVAMTRVNGSGSSGAAGEPASTASL